MTDAGAFLLAVSVLVGMVTLGLVVGRAMGRVVASVRSLVAELGDDVAQIKRSQERIERRLGLLHGPSPVDPLERRPRHPPEPPAYG